MNSILCLSTFTVCLLCNAVALPLFGQSVLVNDIPLSLDDNTSTDFSDLMPLLPEVQQARIVHLKGDGDPAAMAALFRARQRVIQFLHEQAGYRVLVLPIGIYEGNWTHRQLQGGKSASHAATTVYRVWRENEDFLNILRFVQQTSATGSPLEITGGLCRFHAAGKERYAPHLVQFFDSLDTNLLTAEQRNGIASDLGGRGRLSRASAGDRQRAMSRVESLLQLFAEFRSEFMAFYGDAPTRREEHFLKNMQTFIELEQLRAGDLPADPNFAKREKQQNLDWFLTAAYPQKKLIYWEGRGESDSPLPVDVEVFEINLNLKP